MTDTLRRRFWLQDPRHYQILVLASLLVYGVTRLDFEVEPRIAAVLLAGVLAVQALCTRLWRLPAFDAAQRAHLGPLALPAAAHRLAGSRSLAAVIAIASKFALRVPRQARLQPDQLRARRPAARDRPGLGLARAVGQRAPSSAS